MAIIEIETTNSNNKSNNVKSQGRVSSSSSSSVAVLALVPSQTIPIRDVCRKNMSSCKQPQCDDITTTLCGGKGNEMQRFWEKKTPRRTPVSPLCLVPSQSIRSSNQHLFTNNVKRQLGGEGNAYSHSHGKHSYSALMADLDASDNSMEEESSMPTTTASYCDQQLLVEDNSLTFANDNLQPKVKTSIQLTNHQNQTLSKAKKKKLKNKKQKRNKPSFVNYGDIPDVYWRAIPMEHLRSHPLYIPLPHPDTIRRIHSLEEVRTFRQDSWQWDELHRGRCTTSQAAPALGFLEPNAAKVLGIPRSLQNGCMGAYERLRQPALRTLEDVNRILTTGGNGGDKKLHQVWKERNGGSDEYYPFVAKYLPVMTLEEMRRRKKEAKRYVGGLSSHMRIRMSWGNSQEATAILTALNYFAKEDCWLKVKEVGMCGAGLNVNELVGKTTSLLVGASPDSVIEFSDGTLEVLEVKNHCPFVPSEWIKNSKKKPGKYRIRELPLQLSVPAAYIPQLMMEMLCCGDNCRSAIMVRQTATSGAIILRIRRDDEWIKEMIYWLQRFTDDFVNKNMSPPRNFFWEGDDESERYQLFVNRTKSISEEVELVEHVRNNDVQRMLGENGLYLPLFLDQFDS